MGWGSCIDRTSRLAASLPRGSRSTAAQGQDRTVTLRIRARAPADLDTCVRVLTEVQEHDGYPVRWPADPAAWLDPPGTVSALVAELDGALVGHGLIRGVEGTTAAEPLLRASG